MIIEIIFVGKRLGRAQNAKLSFSTRVATNFSSDFRFATRFYYYVSCKIAKFTFTSFKQLSYEY